ncbi:uncharacterized protein LOC111049365 [Nilaparvata lugens]|uniref:uncharacterized protein LOC111049365 n=1 Tax=Nilaparvata lugens TaxID=108931 RepID=UPI00193D2834|nr:uncharacterized protein LOC111049365 [Nilaparvata lugens]
MSTSSSISLSSALSLLAILSIIIGVRGLRGVEMVLPAAVSPGDTATLICRYDLEGEPLYTLKFYKGREEFYRYMPKEHPQTQIFPLPGIDVDVSKSGRGKVVLREIGTDLAGKYRCEVSADAPNFDTEVVSGFMQVVREYSSLYSYNFHDILELFLY